MYWLTHKNELGIEFYILMFQMHQISFWPPYIAVRCSIKLDNIAYIGHTVTCTHPNYLSKKKKTLFKKKISSLSAIWHTSPVSVFVDWFYLLVNTFQVRANIRPSHECFLTLYIFLNFGLYKNKTCAINKTKITKNKIE